MSSNLLSSQPQALPVQVPARRPSLWRLAWRDTSVRLGCGALILLLILATGAPWLYTIDPTAMDPAAANLTPLAHSEFMSLSGEEPIQRWFLFGTDSLGRDIWSRVLYGTRVSLAVGGVVAALSLCLGLVVGALSGYFRRIDGVVMRVMDGIMAIPGILFAIVLVALWRPSLMTVIFAITVPEIPRVARLVRSVVLTVREEPYVEAAIALDSTLPALMFRHILPNAIAPLIVQGTYVCAAAMLVEAGMSFLGIGLPPEIPTWGNVMSEGRSQFNSFPHTVLLPGLFLAICVLAVNMLGDGLRDTLDPKFSKRGR